MAGGGLNFMAKNMVKSFIPVIRENLKEANPFVQKVLSEKPLQDNEREAVFMLISGADGVAYMLTCAVDDSDRMVRIIDQVPLTEFIEELLKKI